MKKKIDWDIIDDYIMSACTVGAIVYVGRMIILGYQHWIDRK